MQKETKYAIFKTKWGYFGLAGTEHVLLRTLLPHPRRDIVKSILLKYLPPALYDKNYLKTLQQQITAYFDGTYVNFSKDIPLDLNAFSFFTKRVLIACRDVRLGRTITYAALADRAGRPAAARAVGSALAKNPLPLIIPCHRVIRSDGKIGGFSSPGGSSMKLKLLRHEQQLSQ